MFGEVSQVSFARAQPSVPMPFSRKISPLERIMGGLLLLKISCRSWSVEAAASSVRGVLPEVDSPVALSKGWRVLHRGGGSEGVIVLLDKTR